MLVEYTDCINALGFPLWVSYWLTDVHQTLPRCTARSVGSGRLLGFVARGPHAVCFGEMFLTCLLWHSLALVAKRWLAAGSRCTR